MNHFYIERGFYSITQIGEREIDGNCHTNVQMKKMDIFGPNIAIDLFLGLHK
jgi:hypothetical protein